MIKALLCFFGFHLWGDENRWHTEIEDYLVFHCQECPRSKFESVGCGQFEFEELCRKLKVSPL